MENNSAKVVIYDALIIGGGFKGMMTAFGLTKQGQKVCIVDNSSLLGGFMLPMTWQGVDMDKGPQFLDGISGQQKVILDEIMSDHEPLETLEFSYASYWNGVTTPGFAIPDYRTLDKQQKAILLYEAIIAKPVDVELECIADTFTEANSVSASYLARWCQKFINGDPDELSIINQNFVTFFGRKLLLDDDLSLELKQHQRLDDAIATNKKLLNHNSYNLYPKGKTLGYFREAFNHKLGKMGVDSYLKAMVKRVEPSDQGFCVRIKSDEQTQQLNAKKIYCAGTIESAEQLLLGSDEMKAKVQHVSQLFYLIELDQELDLPFYIMNYSNDSLTRVTNFNAYGQKSVNGKPIICVEVPAKIGSDIWNAPQAHYPTLCQELEGMAITGFSKYKAIPIPSTYRLALKGYEVAFGEVIQQVKQQYGDGVKILTPHLLSRASIMSDLINEGILQS
jgi:hypothetical protein